MFSIIDDREFLTHVKNNLAAVEQDIAHAGAAVNCTLSAYHLHEWVWRHSLKPRLPVRLGETTINAKNEFVAWLDSSCPHFSVLQDLTNGAKHCRPVSTERVAGYGQGPYGIGPFGAPYLLIDLGDHLSGSERWLVASDMLRAVVQFWETFFAEHDK